MDLHLGLKLLEQHLYR